MLKKSDDKISETIVYNLTVLQSLDVFKLEYLALPD